MSTPTQYQEMVTVAERIVRRHRAGRTDIAVELIVRSVIPGDADRAFALVLALTDQALQSVEESRLDAAAGRHPWQPAFRTADGRLVTPADCSVTAVALAMRTIDAMHRIMGRDESGFADLNAVREQVESADPEVFHGMLAALATYAAQGRANTIDVTAEEPEPRDFGG